MVRCVGSSQNGDRRAALRDHSSVKSADDQWLAVGPCCTQRRPFPGQDRRPSDRERVPPAIDPPLLPDHCARSGCDGGYAGPKLKQALKGKGGWNYRSHRRPMRYTKAFKLLPRPMGGGAALCMASPRCRAWQDLDETAAIERPSRRPDGWDGTAPTSRRPHHPNPRPPGRSGKTSKLALIFMTNAIKSESEH